MTGILRVGNIAVGLYGVRKSLNIPADAPVIKATRPVILKTSKPKRRNIERLSVRRFRVLPGSDPIFQCNTLGRRNAEQIG